MCHPLEEGGTSDGNETLEFNELYSNHAVFEDLSGHAFTNSIRYTFEPGTILVAKEYLVLVREPNAFILHYPDVPAEKIFGPFEMSVDGNDRTSLNNNGEQNELSTNIDPNLGEIIISFRYNDGMPCPTSPDGTGHSLILLKQGGDSEEASTWAPSTYIDGTPGGRIA